jgi:glycosidase
VLGNDPARARVAASAMLMLPGLPFVYYGEEIGMTGTKPDEQIRTPMQWSSAPNGGFTNATPWESLQPDWMTTNVAAQDKDAASLLNHYRSLIRLRNSHSALNRGALSMAGTNDARTTTAAWLRTAAGESVLILVNFGDRSVLQLKATLATALAGTSAPLQLLYEDPSGACTAASISADGKAVTMDSLAAHGTCVLRRD